MADTVTIKVEGLSQLGEAMKDLGFEVQNKLSRAATRAAANLVRDTARSLAPERTGALKNDIGVRRDRKNSYPGLEVAAVGVFSKVRGKQSPETYWRFVEFGSVHNKPARSFLRAGFDEDKSSAAEKMANVLAVGIERKTANYK